MGCTACGHENASDDRFCAECGAPLATACGACDAELKPGAKFCTKCGATVAGSPRPVPSASEGPAPLVAQRKTITVVFGDVGGSTGLGERLDPEAAREVMNQYHRDVLEVIGEHGGTVDKFNGDGFMATFGIPEVNEDDAARAVAAAVEIQERFAPFAADVHERHGGEPITLRIGVNTGEIVIAEGDPDIIGDALNVAARLERACPAGRVLVGAETWRLTRGGWSYEPQGEVTVAGRVEPVEVHLVGDPAADVVGDVDAATPFVGREHELGVLRSTLDDCIEAATLRLVTVVGSPGLGKTRLASEAVRALDAHHSLTIRCERAGTTTFAPIADLIRTVAGASDGTSAAPIADAIDARFAGEDDASRIGPALAGVVGAGPARSTEETFWAVRRLVETLGREGPTVLVVDDIQWAEPVVLDLLEHLVEWVAGAGVLLVCLARPEIRDVRPSFTEPGRRAAHVVSLEGLDAAATNQLASRMLGAELPRDLVDRLPSSTEGNPLFVRELVKMLVADEVIRRTDNGRWELTLDADAVEVPPTIQSLLAARLDRLDPQARSVLERAAVIGPEFAEGALRALLDDGDDLRAVLERLRRMELVEPTGSYWGDEPLHRFHHVLIRDAAYRRLLKGARADLHEEVATWTESRADGSSDSPGSLDESIAFHEEQAHRYRSELGPLDQRSIDLGRRAARRLTAAAERALARDDLTAAASLSSRALACLAPDSDERPDLLLMACEAHLGTGDVVTGEELVDDLDALATDDRTRAWATCFRAQLVSMTEPDRLPEAERDATTAAGVLEALRDDAGAAKGHLTRARILALLGRIGDAESELDLALTAAREADDSRRITAVLGNAPLAALWGPSPVPRAGGRCLDIVRLLRITTRAPAVEATSMRCQALLEALRGRFDTARKMIDRCRRKTAELGLRLGALETELFAGQVEWLAGELDDAESALRTAYTGLSAMRLGAEAGLAGSLLARVLVRRGGLDEADVLIDSAEQMAGRNLKTAAAWRVAKAELLLARGEIEAAIEVARAAVEVVEHTDFVVDQADAHLTLAKALRAGGQSGDADERRARDLADAKGAPALIGDAAAVGKPAAEPPAVSRQMSDLMSKAGSWNPDKTLVARTWARYGVGEPVEFAPGFVHEDFRRGLRDSQPTAPDMDLTRLTFTPLALAGDRCGLGHTRQGIGPDYVIEVLSVVSVDTDGRVEWHGSFDTDDLDRALDILWGHYRRHCEEDGVEPVDNAAARTYVRYAARINLGDPDGAFELVADDYVGGSSVPVEPEVTKSHLREMVDTIVQPGWFMFPKALAVHGDNRALESVAWVGPSDSDVHVEPFRVDSISVVTTDEAGRVRKVSRFTPDRLDEARAELHRTPDTPALAPWTDPPVITTWSKFVALDPNGDEFADLIHPDAAIAIERFRAGYEQRSDSRILAVLGDQLGLFLETFNDAHGDETELVRVVEVDGDGRIIRVSAWDREDVDAAFDAMWDLHDEMTAGRPDPAHRRLSAFRRWLHDCAYLNLGDLDRAWRDSAGDVTWENHRPGERPETRSESRRSHEAMVASGVSVIAEPIVVVGDACLNRLIYRSPTEPGTVPFTTEVLCADFRSPGGKVERMAVWNVDQYDEALADLRRRTPSNNQPSLRSPLSTPIARAGAAMFASIDSYKDASAFFKPDSVIRDHRPGLQFEGGSDFGFGDDAPEKRFREVAWLALLGERAGLSHNVIEFDGGFERIVMPVSTVDPAGRFDRVDRFGPDQVDEALDVLWERYLEHCVEDGVEPIDNPAARLAVRSCVLVNLHEFEAAFELTVPDFELVSRIPGETSDRASGRDQQLALARYLRDSTATMLPSLVAVDGEDRALVQLTFLHPNLDGEDEWINHRLHLCELDEESGLLRRQTVYRDDQLDEALADLRRRTRSNREKALGSPLETAIVRVSAAYSALANENRERAVERFFSADYSFGDHRAGLAYRGSKGEISPGFVRIRGDWMTVLGARAGLSRIVADLPGDYERINLMVGTVDGVDRVASSDRFDVDQVDEALDLLWQRYHEHCDEDDVDPIDNPAARLAVRSCVLRTLGEVESTDPATSEFNTSTKILPTVVAVDGPDRALVQLTSVRRNRNGEYEWVDANLQLFELDEAAGLLRRQAVYRDDQLDEALAELRRRTSDGGGQEFAPPLESLIVWSLDGFGQRFGDDPGAAAKRHFSREIAFRDHRRGLQMEWDSSWKVTDADPYFVRLKETGWLAILGERAGLGRNVVEIEGDFERVVIVVSAVDTSGRVDRMDRFDVDQLDEALDLLWQRYHENCADDGVEQIDNPAARQAIRYAVLMDLHGPDASVALCTDDFENRNLVPGESGLSLRGRQAWRDWLGQLERASVRMLPTLIASDGSDRILSHVTFVLPAEDNANWNDARLSLFELDESSGLFRRLSIYREDQVDQALADLRRRPEEDAPQFSSPSDTTIIRTVVEMVRTYGSAEHYSFYDDDLVMQDHRLGLASVVRKTEFVNDPAKTMVGSVLAVLGDRAELSRVLIQLEGDYERELLSVLGAGPNGLVNRSDRFDLDQLDEALDVLWERYREHCAEDGVEPVDNPAARQAVRVCVLMNLDDPDGAVALYTEDVEVRTRVPGEQGIEGNGREEYRTLLRFLRASPTSLLPTLIATDGPDRVLYHCTFVTSTDDHGADWTDTKLELCELDEDSGLLKRQTVYREDQLDEALTDLRRGQEPSALHDPFDSTIGRLRRATDGLGHVDWDRLSPDGTLTDHRRGLEVTLTAEQWRDTGLPNSPEPGRDLAFLGDRAVLFAAVLHHVTDDGTTYEWEVLNVHGADLDGRMATVDVFDMGELDDALDTLWQRYHEHCAEDGVEPLDNLAVRTRMKNVARWNLGAPLDDAWFSKDFAFVDRRPGEFDNRGRQEHLDLGAAGLAMRMRHYPTAIECVGTHAALFTNHYLLRSEDDGDPWVTARIDVFRVDDDGQIASMHVFDPGQIDEARAELHRSESDRSVPPEFRAREMPSVIAGRRMAESMMRGDVEAGLAFVHDDFVFIDHRPGLANTGGKGQFRDHTDFQVEPGITIEPTLLGVREHAHLSRLMIRANDFEIERLVVWSVATDGRLRTYDAYEVAAVDEAVEMLLQRNRERCEDAGLQPMENEVSAIMLQTQARLAIGEIDELMTRHHPDYENHDRLNQWTVDLEGIRANYTMLIDSGACAWSVPLRVGTGCALHVGDVEVPNVDGSDMYSVAQFWIMAVADDGRLLRSESFPADRWLDAVAEFERRSPSVVMDPWDFQATTVGRATERIVDAMNAADRAAHRGCYAEGFVWHDHRPMVDGTFDADGLVDTLGPIQHIEASVVLQGADRVSLAHCLITSQDFTIEFFNVCWCEPGGRFVRIDSIDIDDLDVAIDRYHEFVVEDLERFGDSSDGQPHVNAASRAVDRMNANLNLHRFDGAAALLSPDVRGEDRRRHSLESPALVGVEGHRANWKAMLGGPLVGAAHTIAVEGESGALQVMRFDQDGFVVDLLTLVRLDAQGRIASIVNYDLDQYDEALTDLRARSAVNVGGDQYDPTD